VKEMLNASCCYSINEGTSSGCESVSYFVLIFTPTTSHFNDTVKPLYVKYFLYDAGLPSEDGHYLPKHVMRKMFYLFKC
jgi:hypothetical protein